MTTYQDLESLFLSMSDPTQAAQLSRFFKTGPGQYGAGDSFLGLKVPQVRAIVKECSDVPLCEIHLLLQSPWHELRLCGFLILVELMKRQVPTRRNPGSPEARQVILDFYLAHAHRANNWDLVDLSCPRIVGQWMLCPQADGTLPSSQLLVRLAHSSNLWEQRIAMVSNWMLIRFGHFEETFMIANLLLHHEHDLIQKAVGWMLREVGKRDIDLLRDYLEPRAAVMPRTMLRYAIEKMPEGERKEWLGKKE